MAQAWLKDLPESDRDEATIFVQPGPTWYFHCSEGTFCPEKKTTKALLKLHERYKKPTEPQQEADLARSISEIIDHDLGELSKARLRGSSASAMANSYCLHPLLSLAGWPRRTHVVGDAAVQLHPHKKHTVITQ